MVELVRHSQPKGTETDMLNLNYYASSLLYPFSIWEVSTSIIPPSIFSNIRFFFPGVGKTLNYPLKKFFWLLGCVSNHFFTSIKGKSSLNSLSIKEICFLMMPRFSRAGLRQKL